MATLQSDIRDPEPPAVIYDGLGPDAFEGYPTRSVLEQVARGFLYFGAGLLVGWLVFHWLADQTAGWIA